VGTSYVACPVGAKKNCWALLSKGDLALYCAQRMSACPVGAIKKYGRETRCDIPYRLSCVSRGS